MKKIKNNKNEWQLIKMNKNAKVVKLDTIVPKTPNKIYEQKMNIVYPEKEIATKVTYLDQLYSKEFNEDYTLAEREIFSGGDSLRDPPYMDVRTCTLVSSG